MDEQNKGGDCSVLDLPVVKGEKKPRLVGSSYILTIITAILCRIPLVSLIVLVPMLLGASSMGVAYLAAYAIIGLDFAYIPFIILIVLSAALSLVAFLTARKLDGAARAKLTKRSLRSAMLLLAPALVYPIAHIFRLYEMTSFYYAYVEFGILAIFIVDVVVFIVSRVKKKKNSATENESASLTIIILFVVELILCGCWAFGVIGHKVEAVRIEKAEEEEYEQGIKALRNSSIEDGLSDLVATECKLKPYRTIYSDNKTEGIFGCDVIDSRVDLFYAAYHGVNENGKTEVSLIEFGETYNYFGNMSTSVIGETRYPYSIKFINAKDETSAFNQATKDFESESWRPRGERKYYFYADGYSKPTAKDYLNVILSSKLYVPESSIEECNRVLNLNFKDKKYECVKAKGDLFKRYINDESNYSAYSTEALYRNRHLYFAPPKLHMQNYAISWRSPFTTQKLNFKYLSNGVYEKHDGNLEWEEE